MAEESAATFKLSVCNRPPGTRLQVAAAPGLSLSPRPGQSDSERPGQDAGSTPVRVTCLRGSVLAAAVWAGRRQTRMMPSKRRGDCYIGVVQV